MSKFQRIFSRAYEDISVAEMAIGEPTTSFINDFYKVVQFCINNCWNEVNHRENFGMTREPYSLDHRQSYTAEELLASAKNLIGDRTPAWQFVYDSISDYNSKLILMTVLAYRALGWRYVKLPLDNERFWKCIDAAHSLPHGNTVVNFKSSKFELSQIDISPFGHSVKLFIDSFGVFNEFLYPQYVYRGDDLIISPRRGDIVIDCGACFGGTSLFFASCVGETGRVYSYEFMKHNIEVFQINVGLNPMLSTQITHINAPVWSESDIPMYVVGSGPGAQISPENVDGADRVISLSIDDLVDRCGLPKVDYIKMDIEGSEFYALKGAERTIRKFKPRLAICVYHKLLDFFELPQVIKEFNPDYKLFFQHASVHGDETLLFAI